MIRPTVLAGFIVCICFARKFTEFKRVPGDDGNVCAHQIFTEPYNMLTKCAMLCEINTGCKRFFFIPGSNFCMGCLDFQIQTTSGSSSLGYVRPMTYIGCFYDEPTRILTGDTFASSSMTNEMCYQYCRDHGFIYSGTQYASHCFCGNSYPESRRRAENECYNKCSGDVNQICGAGYRNSIYT